MNHKDKLLEIYKCSFSLDDIIDVDDHIIEYIREIGQKIPNQKGVFTVLVTLLTHKLMNPTQDIRRHQSGIENGFSGRSIDTHYITPTLKELGLPSMAESGWLTRSLEQPYPYTLDYNGKISDKVVKKAFLSIVDFVEKNPLQAENILKRLLNQAIIVSEQTKVSIVQSANQDKLTIENIITALDYHFNTKYKTHTGAKLPVLAFYALYKCLINELNRYQNCTLRPLGSHTASDRNSKTAGDIEILKNGVVYEAIEIKLNKVIDTTIVRIAIEKIKIYNPHRYYILSYTGLKESDKAEIENLIKDFKNTHGCQIIINGLIPTIKYYLRLITSLDTFVNFYSELVEQDLELKKVHKQMWNKLIQDHLH